MFERGEEMIERGEEIMFERGEEMLETGEEKERFAHQFCLCPLEIRKMIVGGWWIREKKMTKFSPKPSVTSKPDYTA